MTNLTSGMSVLAASAGIAIFFGGCNSTGGYPYSTEPGVGLSNPACVIAISPDGTNQCCGFDADSPAYVKYVAYTEKANTNSYNMKNPDYVPPSEDEKAQSWCAFGSFEGADGSTIGRDDIYNTANRPTVDNLAALGGEIVSENGVFRGITWDGAIALDRPDELMSSQWDPHGKVVSRKLTGSYTGFCVGMCPDSESWYVIRNGVYS